MFKNRDNRIQNRQKPTPRDSEYVKTGTQNSEHANFPTQNSDNANTAA
jgi:hypothetical protein